MLVLILAGVIIGGGLLFGLRRWKRSLKVIIDALALIAFSLFFAEAAESVMRTLLDDTVFMTQVHEVFLSPVFLACGAYLGIYVLSLLTERLLPG
ncbi:transposase [Paenibacillus sp. sptzw28]|uniref:transposase n=1 Tax=Paenibacillus sp. sptzw28 TaxID=715179 RepID=UPI001C6F0983|nr:transposase [Paenibacillus sp. sptzw28]QYR22996.1 transposase [Paenibacillus sp. sptzw28]